MPDTAIQITGLGKRYRYGGVAHVSDTLRADITDWVKGLFRRNGGAHPTLHEVHEQRIAGSADYFWALKDINLEVKQGEVVGIIGRNGAGKSTLLKILSRITPPTTGSVTCCGRLASLLEVGAGFHRELTGRENIFLNGSILGMKRAEIARKLDEIVAFAEVEKFIDTPVKFYSSGMYVRLAFAVAAHLEPEVLVVDEVLAVGDAAFQKKCLGKMDDVSKQGRTILFVSHNMEAITRLCGKAVWLEAGRVKATGDTGHVVSMYLLQGLREGGRVAFDPPLQLEGGAPIRLHSIQLEDPAGKVTNQFSARSPIRVRIEWESDARLYKPRLGFVLMTSGGLEVFSAMDANSWRGDWLEPGRRVSSCVIPGQLLNEGEYVIDVGADGNPGRAEVFDFSRSRTGAILRFEIEDDMTLPNKYYGEEGFRDGRWSGVLLPNIPWTQEPVSANQSDPRAAKREHA
ncbi:MAG: ABC transporter ATP-binding protein [Verrucomicrobia bacterium]|nr:ABC transporter ATP-binding protein [Verrucomicrobiota bacterium]